MLVVKLPRLCRIPIRKTAVALGFALAVALKKVAEFEINEVALGNKRINVQLNAVTDDIVKKFANEKWREMVVELTGTLGGVRLKATINIYADECTPVRRGIVEKGANVLAELKNHTEDTVSFYELFDAEREKMRTVVEEFVVAMSRMHYMGYVARVYAARNDNFAPEDTIPLLSNFTQFANYLYELSPPGLRELVGFSGIQNAIKDVKPELSKYLEKYYTVRWWRLQKRKKTNQHDNAIQLVPLSTESHRGAVVGLRNILAETMRETAGKRAQKIINEKGYLGWEEYVKAFKEELSQRLQTRS